MPARGKTAPKPADAEVSALAQNYLITLYMLREESSGASPTITRVAESLASSPSTEHLGTSLASVAGMIRRMKRDGLVEVKPNKEIIFTVRGHELAVAVMRRHQLAERFLVDILQMPLHQVHAEAHRLEHAISPELERRLAERLGNPATCPFGHPIPGSGYQPPSDSQPLGKVKPGKEAIVERIPEDDPRLVQYLVDSKVVRGQRVKVVEAAPYKGTMTLEVEGKEVVIGLQVAPRIMVNPI